MTNTCRVCEGPIPTNRTYCSPACYHQDEARQGIRAFWTRVRKSGECWEWTGQRHKGYGRVAVHHVKQFAHRIAWELVNGPIPEGMFVMHRCDNPPCIRPAHLMLGTPAENAFDMKRKRRAKGPYLKGSRNPAAKLTEVQVTEIRRRRAAGERRIDLAAEFGVNESTIYAAVCGRKWKAVV